MGVACVQGMQIQPLLPSNTKPNQAQDCLLVHSSTPSTSLEGCKLSFAKRTALCNFSKTQLTQTFRQGLTLHCASTACKAFHWLLLGQTEHPQTSKDAPAVQRPKLILACHSAQAQEALSSSHHPCQDTTPCHPPHLLECHPASLPALHLDFLRQQKQPQPPVIYQPVKQKQQSCYLRPRQDATTTQNRRLRRPYSLYAAGQGHQVLVSSLPCCPLHSMLRHPPLLHQLRQKAISQSHLLPVTHLQKRSRRQST